MTGIDIIAAERARQIAKGYTPEHDREHAVGDLINAADGYLTERAERVPWPVPADWHDLTVDERLATAGALIAAALDLRDHSQLHAQARAALVTALDLADHPDNDELLEKTIATVLTAAADWLAAQPLSTDDVTLQGQRDWDERLLRGES